MSDDRFKLCGGVYFNSAGVLKDEELSMIIGVFESNQSCSGIIHEVSDQNETSSSYSPKEKCERNYDKQKVYFSSESLQVLEKSDHGQSESVEPRRLSLDWNSAFVTSAGLLSDEELSLINKGFKMPRSQSESSYESKVCEQDHTSSSESDEYNMEVLERGLFKNATPLSRTLLGEKMSGKRFQCCNLDKSESVEPRRQSLDWDSSFLTSSGLLNNEELSMINKRSISNKSFSETRIGLQPLRVSGLAHTSSSDSDGFDLEALEFGLFKNVTPAPMKDIKNQKENVFISEIKCQRSCNKQHVHKLPRTPLVNKMSGTQSQVVEQINPCIPESVESRRVSLDWDSDFFTSAGLLKDKELSKINKGFTKHKSNQLDSTCFFDLEDLEGDLFKYVKKRSLYKLTKRSKVNVAESGCGQVTPTNMKPKSSPSSVLSPLLSSSISSASSNSLETSVAELFKELKR